MGERDVFAVAPPGLWCFVVSDSHGSRRGLIAFAPAGAGRLDVPCSHGLRHGLIAVATPWLEATA